MLNLPGRHTSETMSLARLQTAYRVSNFHISQSGLGLREDIMYNLTARLPPCRDIMCYIFPSKKSCTVSRRVLFPFCKLKGIIYADLSVGADMVTCTEEFARDDKQ